MSACRTASAASREVADVDTAVLTARRSDADVGGVVLGVLTGDVRLSREGSALPHKALAHLWPRACVP
jgi:hypothetical protein